MYHVMITGFNIILFIKYLPYFYLITLPLLIHRIPPLTNSFHNC